MVVAQQPDRPAPHARHRMPQQLHRRRLIEPAADVQGPEIAECDRLVAIGVQQSLQVGHDRSVATLGQDSPGLGGEPVVGAVRKATSSAVDAFRQVERRQLPPLP